MEHPYVGQDDALPLLMPAKTAHLPGFMRLAYSDRVPTAALTWTGPYRISDLLASCLDDDHPWPPASRGVYIVSRDEWRSRPSPACHPLYFGGNTGDSQRFCTRIGDLIADLHGLWDGGTGHHSGGQSLYSWCRTNKVHPGSLFIGWATRAPWCDRCAEVELVSQLAASWEERGTLLNKSRPPSCRAHGRAGAL